MIPMIIGALVAAGGAVVGAYMKGKSEEEAREFMRRGMDEFGRVSIPKLQQIAAEELGPSAMEKVYADEKSKDAQYSVLDRLREMEENGGFDLQDKAAMNAIGNQLARRAQAGRSAIQNDFESRGALGSSAEMQMQLGNQQQSNQAASEAGLNTNAQALKRRFEALMARGRMAGDMRSQDFSEKTRRAEAEDAIRKYNAAARGQANMYNAGLAQQDYDNRLKKASGMAGQWNGMAQSTQRQGQDQADMWGAVGEAGGRLGGAVQNYNDGQDAYDEWLRRQNRPRSI